MLNGRNPDPGGVPQNSAHLGVGDFVPARGDAIVTIGDIYAAKDHATVRGRRPQRERHVSAAMHAGAAAGDGLAKGRLSGHFGPTEFLESVVINGELPHHTGLVRESKITIYYRLLRCLHHSNAATDQLAWRLKNAGMSRSPSSLSPAASRPPRRACPSSSPDPLDGTVWYGAGVIAGSLATVGFEGSFLAAKPMRVICRNRLLRFGVSAGTRRFDRGVGL